MRAKNGTPRAIHHWCSTMVGALIWRANLTRHRPLFMLD
jgi:hypothetical protein